MAAVGILSGNRPERPAHSSLTDELWGFTQRCWDQDPLRRPGSSEVVRGLRTALDVQEAHKDGTGASTTDDTVSMSSPQKEVSHSTSSFLTLYRAVSHDEKACAASRPVRRPHTGFRRFAGFVDHPLNTRSISMSGLRLSLMGLETVSVT